MYITVDDIKNEISFDYHINDRFLQVKLNMTP